MKNERTNAETLEALRDTLDLIGALGGSWWELVGYGMNEERAKEIVAIANAGREKSA